ncbi:metalloproteinase inhibitor 2-like [Nerophis lumbriciformis]|uniref:metalloproteinase inhibitor 2-like n=1 Tax=Nerophis lumbriciformis TaxID=546530 RepID=UPI002ADFF806|nr:metalloproteinase inhibitor 2-like [Nerophis lumbriciformis]
MMSWMKCCVFPLVLLCMWQLQEGAHACTCPLTHPQTAFCQSGVVIRAKVVAKKNGVGKYNDVKYDIQHIATFRGPKKLFGTIYTASNSAACGVSLTRGVEYLITGRMRSDGSLYISLCDYIVPWKSSHTILVERYSMGCDCKITRCDSVPCGISGPTECLWTEKLFGDSGLDKQCACIKRRDGSCVWYKEAASPTKG